VFLLIYTMEEQIGFLRRKAEQLRAVARSEPHLGESLRRMADELDVMADRLAGFPSDGEAAER
jgi:hypothetical protein